MTTSKLTSAVALASAAVSAVPAVAAAHEGQKAWTFHHENVMGTSLEMTVRAASHADAVRAEEAALRTLDAQSRSLSAWNRKSELSKWLQTRDAAVRVSPELMQVLTKFDYWRTETSGALDASAETAVRLWKGATAQGRVPTDSEMQHAVAAMANRHWVLDSSNGTAMRTSDAPLALASFTKSVVTQNAAEAALAHGATGVMLNVGGDIVVRGAMTQIVDVANPVADAENDSAVASIRVQDRAVATSGSYRRGFDLQSSLGAPSFSHIVDPRTAQVTGHIASSTVIANDAATAGALATAFQVVTPEEAAVLAKKHDAAYLLITADGQQIASDNWSAYTTQTVMPVKYVAKPGAPPAKAAAWNQSMEAVIQVDLARISDPRYRRPYVAVWVEDKDHYPVKTIALWYDNHQRWLPELKQWYRDDQVRNLAEGSDITSTVTSATRMPGKYTLKWDGKDNDGKLVKAGTYTVLVEISREHGTYELLKKEISFGNAPTKVDLGGGTEGAATLDYRKR